MLGFCLAALLYVLTGGSSVGKTSIIEELEKRGEPVIAEAATDWISSRLEAGVERFWEETDIGYRILSLQMAREKPFLSENGRVFVDRGIFDNHAYTMLYSMAGTPTLARMNEALDGIDLNQRYAAIFYILPYQDEFIPTVTEIRKEGVQEVRELQAALYAIYSRHKHFIVVPGKMSPEERAQFILDRLEALNG